MIPAPGSDAAKNFDYRPYMPLASTLGYDIHNNLPYAIHYNFTIQRQLSASVSMGIGGTASPTRSSTCARCAAGQSSSA